MIHIDDNLKCRMSHGASTATFDTDVRCGKYTYDVVATRMYVSCTASIPRHLVTQIITKIDMF